MKRTIEDMRRAPIRAGAAAGALALVAVASPVAAVPGRETTVPGQAKVLTLPRPQGHVPPIAAAFPDRPERLRRSQVSGTVDDTERVEILVGPTGAPASVTMTQRFVLTGNGPYIIWERSSAQDVEALDDTPAPVLKREAVIWQGFIPGRRELAAKLTLDPVVEAELLPLAVELEWRGEGRIGPGVTLPGPGELLVRLRNRTSRSVTVPTGEVEPRHLAGPLDTLLRYAAAKKPGAPPAAGRGLPATLPARTAGQPVETAAVAPFRVTGTIRVTGGAPGSPETGAITHLPDGLELDGVLQGDGEFTVRANGPGALALALTAYPTLDPRQLQPISGATWAEWARRKPLPSEARDALRTLVSAAASAARADDYAPYLGHHGPGKVTTTFHLRVAPAGATAARGPRPLTPKPLPIALAGVALLAVLVNGTVIWRRL